MTNYAQIWLILAICGWIYGQKWPDLWPNEIVGMAMAIVAIPDITPMHKPLPVGRSDTAGSWVLTVCFGIPILNSIEIPLKRIWLWAYILFSCSTSLSMSLSCLVFSLMKIKLLKSNHITLMNIWFSLSSIESCFPFLLVPMTVVCRRYNQTLVIITNYNLTNVTQPHNLYKVG